MAFGANSKIFASYITDVVNRTNTLDANANSIKVALFGNTGTPDNTVSSANSAYAVAQWVVGNEVTSGAGWVAGGIALSTIASGFSSNVYSFGAANTANGSASTLTAVFGCLVYDHTTTGVTDQGMCFNSFGGTQSVTAGTFTILWNGGNIFQLTL